MGDTEHYATDDDLEKLVNDKEDVKRGSCYDLSHLIMFLTFFAAWVGIGVYAYSTSVSFFDIVKQYEYEKYLQLYQINSSEGWTFCLGFIGLSILFLTLYFIVIKYFPKCTINVTMFLVIFSTVSSFVQYLAGRDSEFWFVGFDIVNSLLVGLVVYTTMEVGVNFVSQVITSSVRVMLYFPSLVLVAALQLLSILLTIFFGLATIFYLFAPYHIPQTADDYEFSRSRELMKRLGSDDYVISHNYAKQFMVPSVNHHVPESPSLQTCILALISICCSMWIIYVIHHIGRAVLHGKFVVWYKSEDKKAVCKVALSKQTRNTFRYHLGTLTFGSTIFTKIQVLRAICASKDLNILKNFVSFLSFIFILGNATTNALIISVIYRKNSFEATKDSIKYLMKNHMKFVATRGVTAWILATGLVFVSMMPVVIGYLYFTNRIFYSEGFCYYPNDFVLTVLIFVGCINVVIAVIFLYLFNTAIEAVLHCSLDSTYFKPQEVPEKLLFTIHSKIQHI